MYMTRTKRFELITKYMHRLPELNWLEHGIWSSAGYLSLVCIWIFYEVSTDSMKILNSIIECTQRDSNSQRPYGSLPIKSRSRYQLRHEYVFNFFGGEPVVQDGIEPTYVLGLQPSAKPSQLLYLVNFLCLNKLVFLKS